MGKKKVRKVGLCFITGYFIKLLKMAIVFLQYVSLLTFLYFASAILAQLSFLVIRMTQEMSKLEIRNSKLLGMANCSIYFKDIFNVLVINVTQKCTYMMLDSS